MNHTTPRRWHTAGLLALGLLAATPAGAAEVDFEGYYRARGQVFHSLSLDPQAEGFEGTSAWLAHRVWLRPRFLINDQVGVFAEIKGFDNLKWGSQPQTWFDASTQLDVPLILGDDLTAPTSSSDERAPLVDLTLWRAWGEVHVGDHRFLIGRMPLHWGSGVWQNDGLGLDGEYGDTVDRIQWEGLFEDQVYASLAFDVNRRGFLNEPDGTFSANGLVSVRTEIATAGINLQYRRGTSPDAGVDPFDLFTADLAVDAALGPIEAHIEAVATFGGGDLDTGLNDVQIAAGGGVVDLGLAAPWADIGFRFGLATGDGNPNDQRLKTFAFDRDYNFGIILFEQPMPVFESTVPTDENGGRDDSLAVTGPTVSNAMVFAPEITRDLGAGFRVGAMGVIAQTAKPPSTPEFADRRYYGSEIDLRVGYTGIEHLDASVTGAVFLPGGYVQNAGDLDLGGVVYGARANVTLRF